MSQKFGIYAVYDEKANVYNAPFTLISDGVALRMFTDLVNDGRSSINAHPEDYSLYKIGVFSDFDGFVEAVLPPQLITRASECVARGAAVGGGAPLKTQSDDQESIITEDFE